MTITIGSNIGSIRAQGKLARATDRVSATSERLASGQRINKASDDAAGLAIATGLSVSNRVYSRAILNISDGISYLQLATSALSELTAITTRQSELVTQAANGGYSRQQRLALQKESDELVKEYNRILATTTFNDEKIFGATSEGVRFQAGFGADGIAVELGASLGRSVGTGSFTFATSASAPTIQNPMSAEAQDFNGDGFDDILSFVGTNVSISFSNGDGTFRSGQFIPTTLPTYLPVTTGDINGDGKPDIVTGGTGEVFLNNGAGSFGAASYNAGITDSNGIALGDLNGDGRTDFAISAVNRIVTYLGDGSGNFRVGTTQQLQTVNSEAAGRPISLVDLNGDGKDDIVAHYSFPTLGTFTFLSNGNGSLSPVMSIPVINAYSSRPGDDFNRDGYGDVATGAGYTGGLRVLQGDGKGNLVVTLDELTRSNIYGDFVSAVEDVNGDGFQDILIDNRAAGTHLRTYFGNGDGTFQAPVSSGKLVGSSGGAFGDVNGDGVTDFVEYAGGNNVNVYFGETQRKLEVGFLDLLSVTGAREAMNIVKATQERIAKEIGTVGASTSRLESALSLLRARRETGEAALSRIQSADVAEESSELIKSQISQQVATAVLSQANQLPALALRLLR